MSKKTPRKPGRLVKLFEVGGAERPEDRSRRIAIRCRCVAAVFVRQEKRLLVVLRTINTCIVVAVRTLKRLGAGGANATNQGQSSDRRNCNLLHCRLLQFRGNFPPPPATPTH